MQVPNYVVVAALHGDEFIRSILISRTIETNDFPGPHNVNPEKPHVTAEARNELRRNLTNDVILYNFIRDRLLEQVGKL